MSTSMKKLTALLSATAILGTTGMASIASAEQGDFLVRGRLISVSPDEKSTIGTIGGKATVSNEVTAELDFTYFIFDKVATELILATTKHNVGATGTTLGDLDLGSVWLLPPTLTMQYHFTELGRFKPYLGAGINYTMFYNAKSGPVADSVRYKDKFGYVLQAGTDIEMYDDMFLNFDIKKLYLKTNVTVDATTAAGAVVPANVKLNPWIIGIGVGKKF